ncbi:MAG TPA: hypothetical protein VI542_31295 [Candidatus Tectomicrobia bacterium]
MPVFILLCISKSLKNHALIKLGTEVVTVVYKRHLAYSPTNK